MQALIWVFNQLRLDLTPNSIHVDLMLYVVKNTALFGLVSTLTRSERQRYNRSCKTILWCASRFILILQS